jgi:hypothetical protein
MAGANSNFSYCPTPGCGKTLIDGPLGETYWCDECCRSFELEEVRVGTRWRRMSLAERAAAIENYGAETVAVFQISEKEYLEALKLIEERGSAVAISSRDVSPSKETLSSLARGISDSGGLRELIDNAEDSARRKDLRTPVAVNIIFSESDGAVIIRDNAGGMSEDDLVRCLQLGSVRKDGDAANVIGRFGVGAKEAIYHFGKEVIIRSRESSAAKGLRVEVPEAWLGQTDWKVQIQEVDDLQAGSTEIRIGALVKFDFPASQIGADLWQTYRRRIESGRLSILVNDEQIHGDADPELLYPPELYPRSYSFQTLGVTVDVDVSMLQDAPRSSGIFFYAFGRLFAHWFWNDPKAKMIFKSIPQHKLNTHFRVDIDFAGLIDDVPINANKDEVAPNAVFAQASKVIEKLCQPYLNSVNWLSHLGNMKFVVDGFSGAGSAHPTAKIDYSLSLGKLNDGKLIPKNEMASLDRFKSILDAEIAQSRGAEPPQVAPDPADATSAPVRQESQSLRPQILPIAGDRSENPPSLLSPPPQGGQLFPDGPTVIVARLVMADSADRRSLKDLEEKLKLASGAVEVRLQYG